MTVTWEQAISEIRRDFAPNACRKKDGRDPKPGLCEKYHIKGIKRFEQVGGLRTHDGCCGPLSTTFVTFKASHKVYDDVEYIFEVGKSCAKVFEESGVELPSLFNPNVTDASWEAKRSSEPRRNRDGIQTERISNIYAFQLEEAACAICSFLGERPGKALASIIVYAGEAKNVEPSPRKLLDFGKLHALDSIVGAVIERLNERCGVEGDDEFQALEDLLIFTETSPFLRTIQYDQLKWFCLNKWLHYYRGEGPNNLFHV